MKCKYFILLLGIALFFAHEYSLSQIDRQVFNRNLCGLNFSYASTLVTNRHSSHQGKGLPATLSLDYLPDKCYEIVAAYVWWGVSYKESTTTEQYLQITNPNGVTQHYTAAMIGEKEHKCWEETGTRSFWADVTPCITTQGDYIIELTTTARETDGITLFVIYQDKSANYSGHLIINDGLLTYNNVPWVFTSTIDNFVVCDVPSISKGLVIASDIQRERIGDPARPYFSITIDGNYNQVERQFWNTSIVNTTLKKNQSSSEFIIDPTFSMSNTSDCYSVIMLGLYYQTETCLDCPTEKITVLAESSKSMICPGDSVYLTSSGAEQVEWYSQPAGFNSQEKDVWAKFDESTKFYLKGWRADGCISDIDSVFVQVSQTNISHISNDTVICYGSSVPLESQATNNLLLPLVYSWFPTEGLSNPNIANPIASPESTMVYSLTVRDSLGCITVDSVQIYVIKELNIFLEQDTIELCIGDSVSIGDEYPGNSDIFTFLWTPSEGLSNPTIANPSVSPKLTTTYYLSVTYGNNCSAHDSITVVVHDLPIAKIISNKEHVICPCDSIELDAGKGFLSYIWSNGDTNRSIWVKQQGDYSVVVVDSNGCRSLPSEVYTVELKEPSSSITFAQDNYSASVGDTIEIAAVLGTSHLLDSCEISHYSAAIAFNKSMLVPISTIPKALEYKNNGVIQFNTARINGDTLARIKFIATLGDAEKTPLTIKKFEWTDCDIPTSIKNSEFATDDLCKAGGVVRLYISGDTETYLDIFPNPVSSELTINFGLAGNSAVNLTVYNSFGAVINKIIDDFCNKGEYSIFLNVNELPIGVYYIKLSSGASIITKSFVVVH